MTRWLPYLLCAALFVCGCNRAAENKQAVRDGIVQHLSKNAALDVSQLSVELGDVKFQGNQATADVAINPKSAPDQGMRMTYTLVKSGDKWQVQGKGAGHAGAGAAGAGGASGMGGGGAPEPKGALGDAPPAPGGGTLPPGHPPVNAPPPANRPETKR